MITCFGASTVYHTFKDMSQQHCEKLLAIDYCGIVIMIFGLALTSVWIGFSLHEKVRMTVIIILFSWAVLNGVLSATPCYAEQRCDKVRVLLNIVTILLCYGLAIGWYFFLATPEEVSLFFGPLMMSYVWLALGFAFYHFRFPECYFTTEKVGHEKSSFV